MFRVLKYYPGYLHKTHFVSKTTSNKSPLWISPVYTVTHLKFLSASTWHTQPLSTVGAAKCTKSAATAATSTRFYTSDIYPAFTARSGAFEIPCTFYTFMILQITDVLNKSLSTIITVSVRVIWQYSRWKDLDPKFAWWQRHKDLTIRRLKPGWYQIEVCSVSVRRTSEAWSLDLSKWTIKTMSQWDFNVLVI